VAEHFLVTGGAGYVGSHMVDLLVEQGAAVTVVDNLHQGHRAALPHGVDLVTADVSDFDAMNHLLAGRDWHAILHFAALSLVGESMQRPLHYLRENASGAFTLIDAAIRNRVPRFILSSTANLFGEPDEIPITEDAPLRPSSPYGESKQMIERALFWASERYGLRSACLRYFNAAGADPKGRIGEDHDPETHLIPLLIDAALGRTGPVTLFGTDYPTPDGTCIRDYVHVTDLCAGHLSALTRLDHASVTYNLGNGCGSSVRDVIAAVQSVSGCLVPVTLGDRRAGDPAVLVASSARIRAETGWSPRYAALEDMVRTAYAWRLAHPNGYGDRSAPTDATSGAGIAR
jgi:UDP-glucose 4-epimerase